MAAKYECQNEACPLGPRGQAGGLFTGGLTEEGKAALGLAPDAATGEGICPNCGEKGKKAGSFEPLEGEDPNQDIHDKVAAMVADPEHEATAADAQPFLELAVAKREEA